MEESLFFVVEFDDIDSSFFEDTDEPRPLYVLMLCRDCEPKHAQLTRGYSPADGIFERPGQVLDSLGGIDLDESPESRTYLQEIKNEMLATLETRRDLATVRGDN